MKKHEQILDRLFRAAAAPSATAEMPFGFDTRIITLARESSPNGSAVIGVFAQRVVMIALAIIALASAGLYRTSVIDDDLPTEYAMTDSAIENNLGE